MPIVTAAIYTRISHDPEGRQAGVERQELDCRRMAADRGWVVLEPIYVENDVSASTSSKKRRPVYEQLLQDVAAGGIDVLLAYSTSRLTRRPREYEALIELTGRTGLTVETVVSGPVQLGTADGRAIARVLAAIDAAEAERVSERVTRSKLQRAEQGLWHGGPYTPFGYRYAPGTTGNGLDLVVDDVRAKLVREVLARRPPTTLAGRPVGKPGLGDPFAAGRQPSPHGHCAAGAPLRLWPRRTGGQLRARARSCRTKPSS